MHNMVVPGMLPHIISKFLCLLARQYSPMVKKNFLGILEKICLLWRMH